MDISCSKFLFWSSPLQKLNIRLEYMFTIHYLYIAPYHHLPPQKKHWNFIGQPCISIGKFHKGVGWGVKLPLTIFTPFLVKMGQNMTLYSYLLDTWSHFVQCCIQLHFWRFSKTFELKWSKLWLDITVRGQLEHWSKLWPGFTVNDFQLLISFLSKNWTKYDFMWPLGTI